MALAALDAGARILWLEKPVAVDVRRPSAVLAAVDRSSSPMYQGTPTEDHLLAVVHFADGVRLTIQSGDLPTRAPILRAHGSAGFAELHVGATAGGGGVFRVLASGSAQVENPPCAENFHHGVGDGNLYYDRLLADILAATREGRSCEVDLVHGIRVLEVITAAERSAREARVVHV
jgi:predicted dehydrogenase